MACKNLVLIKNDIKGQAVSAGWRELNELSEEKTLRYSLNDFVFLVFILTLYFEVKILWYFLQKFLYLCTEKEQTFFVF